MRTIHVIAAPVILASAVLAAPPGNAVPPNEKANSDAAELTGRTEASATVEIRSRLTGYLDKVSFKEGSLVKKGEVLFQLDDRVQAAEVTKAEADAAVANAKLKIAEANLQRMLTLLKAAAVANEDVDIATANMDAAKAESLSARASLAIAKLNLDYTRIKAPINGRIGRCKVDAGNLVKGDGDTSLATVVVTDPLYVAFDVDERTLLRIIQMKRDRKEAKIAVGVAFADEKGYPHQATLDFMDNKVNVATGTVRGRAVMDNSQGAWLPGMFVKVRIAFGKPQ